MEPMQLEPAGETGVVMTCTFRTGPAQLFGALTEAGLMQRWMRGPPDWRMVCCLSEPRPGGRLHCEWHGTGGGRFAITGDYLELEPPWHIRHLERIHLPGCSPDNLIDSRISARPQGSQLRIEMRLPSARAREAMLCAARAGTMAGTYSRIDTLFAA